MKQDWSDTCVTAYTPAAVTYGPKIRGIAAAGEVHPPIGGKGDQRRRRNGYPYAEDTDVGAYLQEYTGVLGFWSLRRMCVSNICVIETNSYTYAGTQPYKVLKEHEQRKKGKYLEACLERRWHFTPLVLFVHSAMGEETKADN